MKVVWPQSPGNGPGPGEQLPRNALLEARPTNVSGRVSGFGEDAADALLHIVQGFAFEIDSNGRILAVSDSALRSRIVAFQQELAESVLAKDSALKQRQGKVTGE